MNSRATLNWIFSVVVQTSNVSELCMSSLSVLQINLKGLDGIQGPVYVGTGCVFKRQALYGYDPPAKDRGTKSGQSMSVCPTWCCGPRKKGPRKAKPTKGGKKKAPSRTDSNIPIFNLEDIEEGIEGMFFSQKLLAYVHFTS